MTRRRGLVLVAKVAVVAAGLAYAFWNVDPGVVVARLAEARAAPIAVAILVSLLAYGCIGLRLHVLVGRRANTGTCIAAGVLGLGVNNVIPARVGELAKALYLSARTGLGTGRVLGLVFWERFLDMNAVLVLGLVALASLSMPGAVASLAALTLAVWMFVGALRVWARPTDRLIARLPWQRAAILLDELARSIRGGVGAGDLLFRLGPLTGAMWLLYALEAGVAMLATGVELSPGQVLAVQVAVAIGFAVPVAPGGLGIAEAALVLTLATFGVAKDDALAAAIVVRVVQYVPTTLGAGLILLATEVSVPGPRARRRFRRRRYEK